MKKLCVVLLVLACMLGCTGCFCGHQWEEASCLEPKTCPLCGKVEGEALGHSWQNATTELPKTCSACGSTEGERIITDERFTTAANQALFGQWEMEMTMTISGAELNLAEYVDEVSFAIVFSFGEDGTMEIKASFKDMDGFVANLVTVTEEMIYLQFEGMEITREEADAMFEDVYGMTVAEYAAEVWEAADWNAMLEMYSDSYVYYAEGDQLNIADSWEDAFASSSYTIADGKLTIVVSDGTVLELVRAETQAE